MCRFRNVVTETHSFCWPPDLQDLGMDDDQHDYDSVASDEDTDSELTAQNNNNSTQRSNRAKVHNSLVLWCCVECCVKFGPTVWLYIGSDSCPEVHQ